MTAFTPPIVRVVLAVAFLAAAGVVFADEEFSERWLEQRELEMTRNLTDAIERETSATVSSNVGRLLFRADSLHAGTAASPPAAPEFSDFAAVDGSALSDRPTMSCKEGPDGSFACVVHPAH